MDICFGLGRLVRRFIGLAVFGALVLLFAGPILALLIPVTVCAAVGFLLWLPAQAVVLGRRGLGWRSYERACRYRGLLLSRAKTVRSRCRAAVQRINSLAARWWLGMRQMTLEVTCGALVGILVAMATEAAEPEIAVDALLGAAAGSAVVLSRWQGSVEQTDGH
jgi:hypothetical protein